MSGYRGYGAEQEGGYGNYGGGYGQSNPYAQSNPPYGASATGGNAGAGNPYAQAQPSNPYGGQSQPQPSNPYGGQTQSSNAYGGQQQYGAAPQQSGAQYGTASQQSGGRHEGRNPGYGQQSSQNSRYDQSAPAQGQAYAQSANRPGNGGGNNMEMTPMNGQAGNYPGGDQGQAPLGRDENAILNECTAIHTGIEHIYRNLDRLRLLQSRSLDDPDASSQTATNSELDTLSSETMTLYRSFTARIKTIKSRPESGNARNKAQVGRVDRALKDAIQQYQQVDRDFRHKLAAQMERQYRIVRPEATDQEVREAVEDTSNTQVFSQALMTSNRRGQSQSALRAVQGRHEAIQKIERQMIELAQLFQDMEAAVIEQEPAVMNIEQKGEETVQNLDSGNKHLDGAVVKARAARRKKWICLGIVVLIILIIVIAIVIWYFVTHQNKK